SEPFVLLQGARSRDRPCRNTGCTLVCTRARGGRRSGNRERGRRITPAARNQQALRRPLPVLARRGRCRRSRGRGGVLRGPGPRVSIIVESLGAFQRVLRVIHDQIPFVVVLGGGPDRIEGDGDVLLAHAEETPDADDERGDLAVAVDQHVHDLADLVVRGIVDVLL